MNYSVLLPVVLAGCAIITLLITFIIIVTLVQKQKQNRYAREKQQAENDKLKAMMDAQENSMSLISRELHDSVGQILGTVKIELYTLSPYCPQPEAQDTLRQCSQLIDQTIIDIRDISHSLNSDLIRRLGLRQAISKELSHLNTHNRITADLEIAGEENHLTPEQELMIFRIFQEAMKNTLKHAAATRLSVSLSFGVSAFSMKITDDGRGFNPNQDRINGIGLANMKERAKAMDATLIVSSAPQSGCKLQLDLPLKPVT